jgi:hypothetical protein
MSMGNAIGYASGNGGLYSGYAQAQNVGPSSSPKSNGFWNSLKGVAGSYGGLMPQQKRQYYLGRSMGGDTSRYLASLPPQQPPRQSWWDSLYSQF